MAVNLISKDTFQKEVLEDRGVVFIDYYVDKNPELAQQYSIFSIPTFMIFKDGKPVAQFVGAMGKEGFLNEIKKVTG